MANRDQPVNGKHSKLSLLETGNLILTDATKLKVTVWATNTVSLLLVQLFLYETGNFVLRNMEGVVSWQSFDSPTDTLLPQQPLTRNTKLVSSRNKANYSSGLYELSFNNNGLLCLLYHGHLSSIYWPPDPGSVRPYNNSKIAVLDALGNFSSSDNFTFIWKEEGQTWVVSWQVIQKPCTIDGACGVNSVCSYVIGSGRKCSYPPGYKMKNRSDWADGCEAEVDLSCEQNESGFVMLSHVDFNRTQKSLRVDKQACDRLDIGFRKFTYTELKKATKSFTEEIGRGAGGIVYKGVLSDN
nr:putative receptor protein kinase zmpk1 [Quercus suber]